MGKEETPDRKWFKGTSREEGIVARIVDFFNHWTNQDEAKDGASPIKPHQLYLFIPSFEFVFKWKVCRKDFEDAAKHIGEELKEEQKTLTMEFGEEYQVELEVVEE